MKISNNFEVVIVGGGLGGLFAAALLSKSGVKVLLCEKGKEVGGYATAIKLADCLFDIGAQDITFVGSRGLQTVADLGLRKKFQRMQPHCKIIFPDYKFCFTDEETIKADLIKIFPDESKNIEDFFLLLSDLWLQIDDFFTLDGISSLALNSPQLLKNSQLTAKQFLDQIFSNDKLKSLLASFCVFYQGSIPSRLSALHFLGLLASYIKCGAFIYQGGSAKLAEDLRDIIMANQGYIACETEIVEIKIKENKVEGIVTKDGGFYAARVVVSNIDVNTTYLSLIKEDKFRSYFEKIYLSKKICLSRCQLFLAVEWSKQGLLPVYFLKGTYDENEELDSFLSNQPLSVRCFIPTAVSSGWAPSNIHCISLAIPSSYQKWEGYKKQSLELLEEQKGKYIAHLIGLLNEIFPDLPEDKIIVKQLITPLDLQKKTSNIQGALYGWELIPEQSGLRRMPIKTPVKGLYLVGQWTMPGGAVCLVQRSAEMAFSFILKELGEVVSKA